MAKADKTATMSRLHSAARLARTALAARLLAHGFYAGQDQIMLTLDREDGQTPGNLAGRLGVRPPTITKTINRLQAQGFLNSGGIKTALYPDSIDDVISRGARIKLLHKEQAFLAKRQGGH